jgi:hypothetical protein
MRLNLLKIWKILPNFQSQQIGGEGTPSEYPYQVGIHGFSINFDSGVKLVWNVFPHQTRMYHKKKSTQVKSEYTEDKRPIPPV